MLFKLLKIKIFINNKSMNESNNEEIESTSNNQQLNIDKTIKKYRKIAIFVFSFTIVASGLFLFGYYCFRD